MHRQYKVNPKYQLQNHHSNEQLEICKKQPDLVDSSTVSSHARNPCAVSVEPNEVPLPVPEELEPNFEDAQETEEVVNMAPKDMPSSYARDAPRFNSDKPEELNCYI